MRSGSLFLFFLSSLWVLSACSKTDPALTKTQLLTQQSGWKYGQATSTDPLLQASIVASLEGSEFVFKIDKTSTLTFAISHGLTPAQYTWAFTADEKNLLLTSTSNGVQEKYELVNLDVSSLQFRTATGGVINTYKYLKK